MQVISVNCFITLQMADLSSENQQHFDVAGSSTSSTIAGVDCLGFPKVFRVCWQVDRGHNPKLQPLNLILPRKF